MNHRAALVFGVAIAAVIAIAIAAVWPADALDKRRLQQVSAGSLSAGPTDGGFAGEITFGRSWSYYVSARSLSEAADGGVALPRWNVAPDASVPAQDASSGMFTAWRAASTFTNYGIGDPLMGAGVTMSGETWASSSGINLPGWTGNTGRVLVRVLYRHETGASNTAGVFLRATSAAGYVDVRASSATTLQMIINSGAQTYTAGFTPPFGISDGDHMIDFWATDATGDATNSYANATIFFDGVQVAAAEHTAAIASWAGAATTLALAGQAANTSPILGRTVFWFGVAMDSDATWFDGYPTAYQDCIYAGLCPNPSTGASAGAGRAQLCGDAGIADGAYSVCALTVTADGRARGSNTLISVAGNYRNTVPTDVYIKPCGCTFGATACRGTAAQGGNTVEPNIEAIDRNAIVIYMDPVYADSTDCGGGTGWRRDESIDNDFQLRYFESLVSYARSNYDVRRIFCVGRSNGAAFCEWLNKKRPTLLSGAVSSIGYLPTTANGSAGMPDGGPGGPIMMTHSSADPTVLVDFARRSVPYWLNLNLGIDAGDWTTSRGHCLSTDGGAANDGSVLVTCGCGAQVSGYDGGAANAVCCTWVSDGGPGGTVRYCEQPGGGHAPPTGEGANAWQFLQTFGESAGG